MVTSVKKSERKKKNTRRNAGNAKLATPPSIQIVFVDPNGTKTNGPSIVLPKKPGRIAAYHNRDQTGDLGNGSGEEGLKSGESGVEW